MRAEMDFGNTTRAQHAALLRVILPLVALALINGLYQLVLARLGLALFWSVDFIAWIMLPAASMLYLLRRGMLPAMYGLRRSAWWTWPRFIGITVVVYATAHFVFVFTRNVVWNALGRPASLFRWTSTFPQDEPWNTLTGCYAALTAGFVESILYIGLPWLLYSGLREHPARIGFTLITAIVFGLVHWEQGPHMVAAAFATQLVYCTWYFRLRSLWPIVVAHSALDLALFA